MKNLDFSRNFWQWWENVLAKRNSFSRFLDLNRWQFLAMVRVPQVKQKVPVIAAARGNYLLLLIYLLMITLLMIVTVTIIVTIIITIW